MSAEMICENCALFIQDINAMPAYVRKGLMSLYTEEDDDTPTGNSPEQATELINSRVYGTRTCSHSGTGFGEKVCDRPNEFQG